MLTDAIYLQKNAVSKLISLFNTDRREIVFKAPTGSGKTWMMADFMNQILSQRDDVVFLVSSLSKGNLAKQNYDKFCEYGAEFTNINPFLINSEISGEEGLFIPNDYNVYSLPLSLYKKGGRLMQGALYSFFSQMTSGLFGKNKKIVLIKDECHIATNNLDDIPEIFISKIIDVSATPSLRRGQIPDIEITNQEAENAKLIKHCEWGNEKDTLGRALDKLIDVQSEYRNLLGVNPCLIIQISNRDRADSELEEVIMPELNARPSLKWMLIVDDAKKCDSNDSVKAKKIPVNEWKKYAKGNQSGIDVIIFKLTISEGWDIPRACMLYQIRDVHSNQLDEQVIGRVRRNPRLLDYETLNENAKKLAMTAWIWGIQPRALQTVVQVKLWSKDILNNFHVKTTKLKTVQTNEVFDIEKWVNSKPIKTVHNNIFSIGRMLKKMSVDKKQSLYSYSSDYTKWWRVVDYINDFDKQYDSYASDYEQSMVLNSEPATFSLTSCYTDNGNHVNISDCIWRRRENTDRFSFDSEAEREWCAILYDLSKNDLVAKINISDKQVSLFNNTNTSGKMVYLWGKNYLWNSMIKFEYYKNGVHVSYPDFIMKDKHGRIHIFEVKSLNVSSAIGIKSVEYEEKANELKSAYKRASLLTGQIFYLPVLNGDIWHIFQYMNGEERTISKEQFLAFVQNEETK